MLYYVILVICLGYHLDLPNTNTDKFKWISPFSNNENWQKILTSKKYIHKEKHQMSNQKSATKSKQLKISCLQQKEKCPQKVV